MSTILYKAPEFVNYEYIYQLVKSVDAFTLLLKPKRTYVQKCICLFIGDNQLPITLNSLIYSTKCLRKHQMTIDTIIIDII